MSRILWIRSKRVSEVGGEESAHLPPKRGSYVMRVCAIVGRSWLREFPTTGFGHVARWGSRRRPRTGIGYAVISRRRVLEERATGNQYLCKVRDHDQALMYINRKICGKDERTNDLFEIWNNCAQIYVKPHDIQAINKPWNQQTFTITSHYRRPDVNDPVTSMDL